MSFPSVRRFLRVAPAVAGLLPAVVASAQTTEIRVLDRRPDGVRVEVTAAWDAPLATTAEAVRARALTRETARALGAEAFVGELLDLPTLANGSLTVETAEGESVALAPGAAAADLDGPVARLGRAGLFRGEPVADLTARLLAYDAETQRLTRYRRLVLNVRYGASGLPRTASRAAGRAQSAAFSHLAVTRSVLADGAVYKIPITEEGVYRLDAAAITALGLTAASVDPARIRVFHNGGAPVPARNAAPRPADLVEVPTLVRGGGDGRFDTGDGVTFFVQGPQTWHLRTDSTYSAQTEQWVRTTSWAHVTNPYTTQTFVFVKVGEAPQRTLATAAAVAPGAATTVVTGRYVNEFDAVNLASEGVSGLTWTSPLRGPSVSPFTLVESANLPGLAPGPIRYETRPVVQSRVDGYAATVRFEAAGQTLYDASGFSTTTTAADALTASAQTVRFDQAYGGGTFALTQRVGTFMGTPDLNQIASDWARAFYPQALTATGGYLRFVTPRERVGQAQTFALAGFAETPEVWDVTDPLAPVRLPVSGTSVTVAASARPREIVAFADAGVRRLAAPGTRVAAQNLHAASGAVDYLIVTPALFAAQAEALAAARRADGLRVEVVGAEAIYNEFAGGVADPRAFRDFFRLVYLRGEGSPRRLRYALFFGDGHANYRSLGTATASRLVNHLPPYQTDETFSSVHTYTSDDYFGLLDETEGLWGDYDDERVDIGVGRFPVQTTGDADGLLRKTLRYDSPETFGAWRTQYLLTADDGPRGASGRTDNDLHAKNADDAGEAVTRAAPHVTLRKVYAMMYPRVYAVKFLVPGARQAILDGLTNGALVFNYSGHGSPEALGDEDLLTKADVAALDNGERLPVFITATCSFGRWDLDHKQSAGETAVLNPGGGALSALTTVRVVYTGRDSSSLNPGLNRRINAELFRRGDDGLPTRLGEALLQTKQYLVGYDYNGRKFNLLGDPAQRFGTGPLRPTVDRVNGVAVAPLDSLSGAALDSASVPLRALDLVTLEGTVRDAAGRPLPDFNGRVTVSAYDADREVTIPYREVFTRPTFSVSEVMWQGEVVAQAGRFTAQFVVPRDISYANRRGRIVAYAQDGARHGGGATAAVRVGGSNPTPLADVAGPRLSVYLGDSTFVSGGITGRTPELIVRLRDESGINLGGGVGHELLLSYTVGGETRTVNLAPYYRATRGYQEGEIRYRMPELPAGAGRLTVRAWDPVGNAGEASADFTVEAEARLALARVANFPNPTAGPTRIAFEHNQPTGTPATAEVRVYTLAGRLVRRFDAAEVLPEGTLASRRVTISWDGRDADGDRLAPGVYLYRVRVEVPREGAAAEVAESIQRLAVVR